ncbi:hypothetical protein [Prauserella flavalba]|uniref:hypothetical protein n=1 Tax=Prauserella flavalba TaxID=1477506 RepID=UPI0036E0BAF1
MARPTHACPCGCARPVPRHKFSCFASWQRLPGAMKRAIVDNRHRNPDAHRAAMREARTWLRGEDAQCMFWYELTNVGNSRRCTNEKADGSDHCEEHWWADE